MTDVSDTKATSYLMKMLRRHAEGEDMYVVHVLRLYEMGLFSCGLCAKTTNWAGYNCGLFAQTMKWESFKCGLCAQSINEAGLSNSTLILVKERLERRKPAFED